MFVDFTCFVSLPLACQLALTCSKSTTKTVGRVVKSAQSITKNFNFYSNFISIWLFVPL